jgi:hypothetical protein
MVEATSTLFTEQATETCHTPLTTIELHRMATMSLVTSFGRAILAACPLIHRSTNPKSLSLLEVKPDVASPLL